MTGPKDSVQENSFEKSCYNFHIAFSECCFSRKISTGPAGGSPPRRETGSPLGWDRRNDIIKVGKRGSDSHYCSVGWAHRPRTSSSESWLRSRRRTDWGCGGRAAEGVTAVGTKTDGAAKICAVQSKVHCVLLRRQERNGEGKDRLGETEWIWAMEPGMGGSC